MRQEGKGRHRRQRLGNDDVGRRPRETEARICEALSVSDSLLLGSRPSPGNPRGAGKGATEYLSANIVPTPSACGLPSCLVEGTVRCADAFPQGSPTSDRRTRTHRGSPARRVHATNQNSRHSLNHCHDSKSLGSIGAAAVGPRRPRGQIKAFRSRVSIGYRLRTPSSMCRPPRPIRLKAVSHIPWPFSTRTSEHFRKIIRRAVLVSAIGLRNAPNRRSHKAATVRRPSAGISNDALAARLEIPAAG